MIRSIVFFESVMMRYILIMGTNLNHILYAHAHAQATTLQIANVAVHRS